MRASSAEGYLRQTTGDIGAHVPEPLSESREPLMGSLDPDTRLMLQARNGNGSAFEELFARHSRSVVNLIYRSMGIRDRDRAEEIAQDVFLRIYQARARYEPRARFSTYLYRIALNACLNEKRSRRLASQTESLDERHLEQAGEELSRRNFATPEGQVLALQGAAKVQEAIDRLPSNQKIAFVLARIEGFSYVEVAECMTMSVGAVKSLIFRATQSLRQELGFGRPSPQGGADNFVTRCRSAFCKDP